METNRHWLDQRSVAHCYTLDRDNLLPRQSNVFAHGTIALNAQGLVVLASIVSTIAT